MENQGRKPHFGRRLAYGAADIYGGGAFVIISTFFTVFLVKALGMNPALAGSIPLIGKIWDAITDPIMGNIADRTQSKLGAKRLYILIGSIISAITFFVMWTALPTQNATMQYIFYVLMYMLFSTGFTIVMVPYNALLPDMIDDYTFRSKFAGTRTALSAFGAILAGLIPTLLIKDNTNAKSYMIVAAIFSVIFFFAILITFLGTWEKVKQPVRISMSQTFVQTLTVFKGKTFRQFLAIFLLGQGAADFVTGLAVYYVDDVLNCYHDGMFTYLMGTLLIAQFVGTILFSVLMKLTNKKMPILVGFPIRIVASLALLLFTHQISDGAGIPGQFFIVLGLSFIIGLGMAASTTTIYAILADMADVDELITSINRPGTCSAMATFVRKIATGLSTAIIGFMVNALGYDAAIANAGGRQALSVQHGIGMLYVIIPTAFAVGALLVVAFFPLGKKEFEVIKKDIARRKGEENSIPTPEEIRICQKITGYSYDRLWDRDNALKFRNHK